MDKKSKFIVDEERQTYVKQLEELMQKVNPKQRREVIEKLKRERVEKRSI